MTTADEPTLVLDGSGSIAEQIETQIRCWIVAGVLMPGEPLPTVRALAVALAVSPHAIERAYQSLEQDGLVTTEDDSGLLVAAPAGGTGDRPARLCDFCTGFLDRGAALGFSAAEVAGTIQELLLRRSTP
jgi:GntR family transcriptional regulator